jgi:hypothetical protein
MKSDDLTRGLDSEAHAVRDGDQHARMGDV